MSETLPTSDLDVAIISTAELGSGIAAFDERRIAAVGMMFDWQQPNGTRVSVAWRVERNTAITDPMDFLLLGEHAQFRCAVNMLVESEIEDWPEQVVAEREAEGEIIVPVKPEYKLLKLHQLDVTYSMFATTWQDEIDYILSRRDPEEGYADDTQSEEDAEDMEAVIDHAEEAIDSSAARTLIEAERAERAALRMKQVKSILRCYREKQPFELDPFLLSGEFVQLGAAHGAAE